jgi:hypothetical protein
MVQLLPLDRWLTVLRFVLTLFALLRRGLTGAYGTDATCADNCCRFNCGWKQGPLPVEDYPIANSEAQQGDAKKEESEGGALPAYTATPQMSASPPADVAPAPEASKAAEISNPAEASKATEVKTPDQTS